MQKLTTQHRWLVAAMVVMATIADANAQQGTDYSLLAQPTYADRLKLTDQQRAKIAEILDQRVSELVKVASDRRDDVVKDSNARLAAVLTPEQRAAFDNVHQSGKIQFNFRGQPWSSVLQWFADQADLSLVMDSEPSGKFTYSDTNDYTPTEAIDLLNSVLLSKDYTLIRREKMLILADTSDGIPFEIVPTVSVDKLAERGKFEIVSTEFPVGARPMDVVVQEVTPLVGSHGQVTPMAAAKKLLVTETAGKLRAINILIASIPEPKKPEPKEKKEAPKPVFATYPAPGLDGEATVETLQALFSSAQIRFDPNADEVHAHATPEMQKGIEASIQKMIENASGDNADAVTTYDVDPDRLDDLVEQVQLVHPDVQVKADADNQRILIVGDARQQTAVQTTLQRLDVGGSGGGDGALAVAIHQVDPDSTDALSALVQDVVPRALVLSQPGRIVIRGNAGELSMAKETIDQYPRDPALERTLTFYPLQQPLSRQMLTMLTKAVPDATVEWLDDEGRLSVVATQREHQRVTETLAQIEQAGGASSRQLKLYPISQLQRDRFAMIQRDLPESLSTMKINPHASLTEMAAWGSERQHAELTSLLAQLDVGTDDTTIPVQTLAVDVEDDRTLLASLRKRFPQLEMIYNDEMEVLSVWAQEEEFEKVRQEYDKLAAALPPRREPVLETYAVDAADLSNLQRNLQSLVPDAVVTADSANGRLIVRATAEDQTEVQSLIEKLSTDATTDRGVTIAYPLEKGDADAIVKLLSRMQPEWKIVADERSNRVLVAAPLSQQPRIQALVRQLDADPDQASQTSVVSYPFRTLNPGNVLRMLQPLFPRMRLTVDADSKQLVASGTGLDHQELAQAIARVDGNRSTQTSKVVGYDLGDTKAEEVENVLMQLVPAAVISSDPDESRIFVWADQEDHQAVAEAIDQFTQMTGKSDFSLRTYPLPVRIGPTAITMFQSMADDAAFSLDQSRENLVVWASEKDHQTIHTAFDQLNQQTSKSDDQVLRVYRDKPEVIALATEVLDDIAPDARSVDAEADDRLILWAIPDEHDAIESLLGRLRTELGGDATDRKVGVYPISDFSVETAESMLREQLPDATVLESDDYQLMVLATEQEHDQIKAMLEQLRQANQDRKSSALRQHPVRKDLLPEIREHLEDEIPQLRFVDSESEDALSIWATEQQHERIVALIESFETAMKPEPDPLVHVYPIDPEKMAAYTVYRALDRRLVGLMGVQINNESNSLVARGTPAQQAEIGQAIEAIVSQLPDTQRRRTAVYPLQMADPTSVSRALARFATDATIVPEPESSTLIVTALEKDHERIAEVIDKLDVVSGQQPVVQAYPIRHGDPQAIYRSVSLAFLRNPDYSITYQDASKTLFVIAKPRSQATFAEMFQSLDVPESKRELKVYPLELADAVSIMTAVRDAEKDAVVTADRGSNSLLVTGTEQSHESVAKIIQSLDVASGTEPVLKAYPIRNGDPAAVSRALTLAFYRNPNYTVSYQAVNETVFVTATPKHQAIFAEMFEAMDVPESKKVLKVYPLDLAEPSAVARAVSNVASDATVVADSGSSSLLVTGDDEDHAVIGELIEQLDVVSGQEPIVEAYPIKNGDPTSVSQALTQAFLRDRNYVVTYQSANETIFVTATPRYQAIFAQMFESLDVAEGKKELKVYPLKLADPDSVADAIADVRPEAIVSADEGSNSLLVTGTDDTHEAVRGVVEQLDVASGQEPVVRAYPIRNGDPASISRSLSIAFYRNNDFNITYQQDTSTVFVIATPRNQSTFAEMFQSLDVPESTKKLKVYPLTLADPDSVAEAIEDLAPTATVTADAGSNSIMVTGPDDVHAKVHEVIGQLDVASGQEPVMRAYPIRNGDPDAIADSIIRAFARSRDYSITYQESNETLFVLAMPKHQVAIDEMLQAMDQPPPQRPAQTSQLYPLANVSATVAASTIDSIVQDEVPRPEVLANRTSNSLVVVATDQQHSRIAQALQKLDGDERILEVFQLRTTDPYMIEMAVRDLFAGLIGTSRPYVSTDYGTNKIFVRGTEEQLTQIRALLSKLGEQVDEGEKAVDALGTGTTRRIPFAGDTESAVRQMQSVWSRIRGNRIKVIYPAQQRSGDAIPWPGESPKQEFAPEEQGKSDSAMDPATDARVEGIVTGVRLVAQQDTLRAALPAPATQDDQGQANASHEEQVDASEGLSDVVVIPGPDSITISSEDTEALDRMETLLRGMSQLGPAEASDTNFAVFMLQNSGAIDMEMLLKRLVDEMPFMRGGLTDAVVVSDERLNALIVYGSPRTREIVGDLLEVLDTDELPDFLNVYRPEIINLENTQADRVLTILRTVYRSQMSTAGGRRPLQVPRGVGASVASVLQQLNAAAAGPLLTLEVDEAANALIVRAPAELRDEIRSFVTEMDQRALNQSNRNVKIIRLKRSKSDSIERALREFIAR
ncbi:secretin N-terminal domain-containing protein [Crateriforma spongiae]|uniref:secretin N-terminal domain-containing protein n=1 Tax=Crateriforma spongiae TaxID=2724528 RepID=UPI0039AF0FE2